MKTAIKTAQLAASKEFDRYLDRHNATAAMHVPEGVVSAAKAAYASAGGSGEIEVTGHGNSTHPVISVEVRRAT